MPLERTRIALERAYFRGIPRYSLGFQCTVGPSRPLHGLFHNVELHFIYLEWVDTLERSRAHAYARVRTHTAWLERERMSRIPLRFGRLLGVLKQC